ncbi:hypothetical protein [Arenimonas caeni]|uniref:Uncharacterized protein n=1 Tax=Arenimonas caeni TaxID=2058085 RepID=A0A2P6M6C9_9GAMM|nr:hypothetical protein [Arenimonas caeni]MDY0021123.1 hypothetical protein [Arenimonas caeni]PRH81556.1 hypothetical protein C6N40_12125 [Arenimonas caeni]
MSPTHRPDSRPGWLLPAVAWLAGVAGMVAIWLAVALAVRGMAGWLALLAAVDLALLLRLSAMPASRARAWAATAGTALAIAISYWFVASMMMGLPLGLRPLEAASRMGPVLASELLRHAASGWDLAWALLALPLAWRLAR